MHIIIKYLKITIIGIVWWTSCSCQQMSVNKFKHILMVEPSNDKIAALFRSGRTAFRNCPVKNCYVTNNKDYFHGRLKNFDAVVFNGLSMPETPLCERYPHQKYVYVNLEAGTPICNLTYDSFFNWTATYKLDSDFVFQYLMIKNATGHIVGPSLNMKWVENMADVDEKFDSVLKKKRKAAAWFVSKCSEENRNRFVEHLDQALMRYNLKIDIYGPCGTHKCPKFKLSECLVKLQRDYYFYLALEHVQAEDYVTEKVIPALQNYVVPIMYGGANYSRFLPPGSFLNGRKRTTDDLAAKLNEIINSPSLYREFFKWRRYYRYSATSPGYRYAGDALCKFCKALNDEDTTPTVTVKTCIRQWWDVNFEKNCKDLPDNKNKDVEKTPTEEITNPAF